MLFTANSITLRRSSGARPTGRQMRVCRPAKWLSATACTPWRRSASMSTFGSSPARICSSVAPSASPTYSAECDQVDCVRYLIAPLTRVWPSTSSTSPGSSAPASFSGGEVAARACWGRGVERYLASRSPNSLRSHSMTVILRQWIPLVCLVAAFLAPLGVLALWRRRSRSETRHALQRDLLRGPGESQRDPIAAAAWNAAEYAALCVFLPPLVFCVYPLMAVYDG